MSKKHKEFLKKLNLGQIDRESCIQYFLNLAEEKLLISFSDNLIISLFKHKHDYIFKFLFDHGILYCSRFHNVSLSKIPKKYIESESFVYALCYPKFIFTDYSFHSDTEIKNVLSQFLSHSDVTFSAKECLDVNFSFPNNYCYNENQKKTIKHIQSVYDNIKFLNFYKSGKIHPYAIYYFKNWTSEPSVSYFIEKVNFYIEDIEKIKKFIFSFYPDYFKKEHFSAFIDFLSEKNKLSFEKLVPELLINSKYYNYCLRNKFKIKHYRFDFHFIKSNKLHSKLANRIIDLLDENYIFDTIYSITDNIFYEPNDYDLNFYKNLLLKLFIKNENLFLSFFEHSVDKGSPFNQTYNDEEFFNLFLILYTDNKFKSLFYQHLKNLNLIPLIQDFLWIDHNISNF